MASCCYFDFEFTKKKFVQKINSLSSFIPTRHAFRAKLFRNYTEEVSPEVIGCNGVVGQHYCAGCDHICRFRSLETSWCCSVSPTRSCKIFDMYRKNIVGLELSKLNVLLC